MTVPFISLRKYTYRRDNCKTFPKNPAVRQPVARDGLAYRLSAFQGLLEPIRAAVAWVCSFVGNGVIGTVSARLVSLFRCHVHVRREIVRSVLAAPA